MNAVDRGHCEPKHCSVHTQSTGVLCDARLCPDEDI